MQSITGQKLKLLTAYKGWWTLIGVLALYLLFLLARYYTSGAYDLNNLLTWGAVLWALPFVTNQFEPDTRVVIKIGTLGLLAVTANVQLYILAAMYRPGAGSMLQVTGFFGLVLAAIVVLCYFDMKKGRKRLNYRVVWTGFIIWGGLLALSIFFALR